MDARQVVRRSTLRRTTGIVQLRDTDYADLMLRSAPLVLVVDEDHDASTELTRWLLAHGLNAVMATSCLEAMAVIDALPLSGLIGDLALRDGSFFDVARALRLRREAVVIGYADVDVRPPPELDACFVRPLDLGVLQSFLDARFRRRRSGEHLRISLDRCVPAARPLAARRRR
jgi:hypothetical protein